ncbi:YeiH family protein [Ammoniphilus resinae]|uniref:Integral membrane protein (TIGR00698 family) n=1 Tax=Ammoniphilus resinae TaxID=861532 RepID=A0ABS4GTK9_9BACL|nr:putative sulfate exporter family transporter [Ammoniphilus resinae]MBP1933382.1 putative integral membrane protein (TIGR00698 family) [Ammoniphilus resinae]
MQARNTPHVIHGPERKQPDEDPRWRSIFGVGFTFFIAMIGMGLAKVPLISHLGSMVTAILLAIFFRQFFGYPEILRTGIQFSGKKILRYAIVLFGFRLNVEVILQQGIGLLLKDVFSIVLAIIVTMLIAKWIKAEKALSFMLAVGTGVCGAAAIAAVSPIIKANDDDTAIGVGMIALMGTIFTIIYTLLLPILPLTNIQYGVWSGVSLHEIAHVAAAAAPAGADALAIALLAKLGRVLLLVPLCFLLAYWMKRKDKGTEANVDFPWFLLGFIITSLIGTYAGLPQELLDGIAVFSSFLLTAAMVGLGLNVSFQALKQKGLKPLFAMLVASILLSIVTFTYQALG